MKRLLVLVVSVVLALSFLADWYGVVYAAGGNDFYVGMGGSVALENFSSNDEHETLDCDESWGMNLKFGYRLRDDRIALEIDYDNLFEFDSSKTINVSGVPTEYKYRAEIFTLMPAVKISIGSGRLKNYFSAGVGYMYYDSYFEKYSKNVFFQNDRNKSDVCAKACLGLDYFIKEDWSLGVEANYVTGMGDLDDIQYLNFVLGVCYYFGRR